MKTCCALGENQDAILGHVASRGDRNPRAPNKTPAGGGVNPLSEPRQDDDLLKESSNRDANPFKPPCVKVVEDDGVSVRARVALQARMVG
jgi:hypothetical protein